MLLAAAHAHDGVGKARRESEFPGTIHDLGWPVAFNKRFRDNEARTKCADSSTRGGAHSGHIPFNAGQWMNRDRRQPTTITSPTTRAIGKPLPDHHGFLIPILAMRAVFRNPAGNASLADVYVHIKQYAAVLLLPKISLLTGY